LDNERKKLEQAYLAALEIEKRYENKRIDFYLPCCTAHGGRRPDKCPTIPCPESKHTKFHLSKARNRVVFGGNRSSKTFSCNKEFVYRMALKKHPLSGETFRKGARHGRILAQDYSLHEKKHIPEIYEWLPTSVLAYGKSEPTKRMAWDKSYDSRNHLLHLVDDSWIDFQTYEQDSSKGESVDLDIWWADEEIPEDWYSACNSRIVTRGGVGIMGVTPLYRLTWAMRFLDEASTGVEVFKWGIRDNPHNSNKAIREFLQDVPELEREARENGEFIEFKGIRYKALDRTVHLLTESVIPQPGYPVIMSMDPHQRKGTAITWAFIDPYNRVTFFDELQVKGTAKEVVSLIGDKEKSHRARTLLRIADPAINKQISGFGSGRTTLTEFEEAGMGFTMADNNEVGYDVVESYLNWDKTKPLSTLNSPSVYFTKDVPLTWYSMTHLRWDEFKFNHDRDPKERVKDKDKDFADNVRYTLILKPRFSDRHQEPQDINFATYGL
jgi:phage terminase large subunit-like protein